MSGSDAKVPENCRAYAKPPPNSSYLEVEIESIFPSDRLTLKIFPEYPPAIVIPQFSLQAYDSKRHPGAVLPGCRSCKEIAPALMDVSYNIQRIY